ncbi:hypothetical protein C8Q78DRAFT_1107514 [Trametes maxima]|nr:hypothetical protein C8Q78DRAFT_1107514 [Trametes maxima]
MLLTLCVPLLSALLVAASPSVSVSYRLDDQLPPIARIHTPFAWTFSPDTFLSSTNSSLQYAASSLPSWLAFDTATRTLHGTPDPQDEGSPRLTITATDPKSSDSVSSAVTLCVTHFPPPELRIPVEKQFYDANPSLSSVFLVSNTSALYNSRPALRVPPKWSYSIGFQYNTFVAPNNLYYAASQADGSPLPDWVNFDETALTFGGVTPRPEQLTGPHIVSLLLHASDQEGYSAASVPFDLVVAAHDVSLTAMSLPTINLTTGAPFQLALNSAVDFAGVLVDNEPVAPSNITALDIDTSGLEGWLRYNETTKTLSGQPPDDFSSGILPVALTTSVNQTLQTTLTVAAVPSFFTTPDLQPLLVNPGSSLSFNLAQYFSNSSGLGKQNSDVNLTAAFDPLEAGEFLSFDAGSAHLSGTVPQTVSYPHVAVTFTAYSHVTHSTSHTTLPISFSTTDYAHQHNATGGLSTAARAKLLLGLKIAFGVISAFVAIAIAFAVLRRCTHVPDTAATGEEGQRAWTDAEMKWYGIGIEVDGRSYMGPGGGEGTRPASPEKDASGIGIGMGATLSRVLTRTLSNARGAPLSPASLPQSPGVMKKAEFLGALRATARIVSDRYRRVVSGPRRPVISNPTLIIPGTAVDIEGLPTVGGSDDDGCFAQFDPTRYAPSGLTSLVDSPTSSTDARSVPRRRADFAPPRREGGGGASKQQADADRRSMGSLASSFGSARTHEAEAVVQRATRAVSVRSVLSGVSVVSAQEAAGSGTQAQGGSGRPRLVPFTSAARVPVPKMPVSGFSPDMGAEGAAVGVADGGVGAGRGPGPKRIKSQVAKVFRGVGGGTQSAAPESGSTDELRTGIEYVRALGDDGRSLGSCVERSPVASFSSIGSSRHGHDAAPAAPVAHRVLARVGERFKYRVRIVTAGPLRSQTTGAGAGPLEARLVSGEPLPGFVRVEFDAVSAGGGTGANGTGVRVVDVCGTPGKGDVGEVPVGVYERESGRMCLDSRGIRTPPHDLRALGS